MQMIRRVVRALRRTPKAARFQYRKVRYSAPNPFYRAVATSDEAERWLSDLKDCGVVCIPDRFTALAEYMAERYLPLFDQCAEHQADVESDPFVHECIDRTDAHRIEAHLSFKDPRMAELYFDEDLCGLACNYYRRQAYFRNQPAIWKTYFEDSTKPFITGKFHKDRGLHQLTYILLLNDLTESDTHMQFAIGSHKKMKLDDLRRFDFPDERIKREYEIQACVGKRGTLFVFDAGDGFHRAVFKAGTVRMHLHLILTSGQMESDYEVNPWDRACDETTGWTALAEYPPHIRHMMDKVAAT